MNRTLIAEIVGGLLILIISGLVGGLWQQVDGNTKVGLHNKDSISAVVAAGDAEIKRSTAIDDEHKIDIEKNFVELNKQEDFMHEIDKEVGSLTTAVRYIHGEGELAHTARPVHKPGADHGKRNN